MSFRVEEFAPKIFLYRNVTNAKEIRQCILKGELQCTIVKPNLITDEFQVRLAVHNALMAVRNSTAKTRSVYTEIIYSLSGSKKIADSLKTFGIGDNDQDLLVIIPDTPTENAQEETKITKLIQGDIVPLSDLPSLSDPFAIKKLFKIKDEELKISSLSDAVITRMSAKEVCNF